MKTLTATGEMTLAHEIPARSIVIFLPPIKHRRPSLLPPPQISITLNPATVVHELSTWITHAVPKQTHVEPALHISIIFYIIRIILPQKEYTRIFPI